MLFQYTPYMLPLILAGAISAALAFFAWHRHRTSGAAAFGLLGLVVAEWSFGNALELASVDLASKLFWANVEYFGIAFTPFAWFAFVLQYTGRGKWLTRRNCAWLSLLPILTIVLTWSNDWHGLIRSNVVLDTSGPFSVIAKDYGAWFWIDAAYNYLLILISTILLIQRMAWGRGLYRSQTGALLFGAFAPWAGNLAYISKLSPIPRLDLTPVGFALSGVMLAWAVFRFRLLDVVPVARDTVIENISDGVIVLDEQTRIIDINPAAEKMIGRFASEVIGQPAAYAFSARDDLLQRYQGMSAIQEEIVDGEGTARRVFAMTVSPLWDRQHHSAGHIVILHDVTERKRMEDTLRASEEHYRLLAENATDFIWTMDMNLRLMYISPSVLQLRGYSVEEVMAQTLDQALTPDSLRVAMQAWMEEIAKEAMPHKDPNCSLTLELEFICKNGSTVWTESKTSGLRDRNGNLVGILGVTRDIAERKRAQDALKASEQYARSIIDSSLDMIITTDNERRIVEFNGAVQDAFGYTREEILGNHINMLYANPHEGETIRQALLRDGKFLGEVLNKRKNGETFTSLLTASILQGANGEILGVVGVSRDVTERTRAEETRRRAEEKYRTIFDGAVEGIFQSTPDGHFINANPALARMWGYASPQELISSITDIARQVYANPARRADFRRLIEEQGEVHGFEFQVVRRDGSMMWVSENARSVHDANGALLYYEGTTEDITARTQAEEALRESEERFSGAFEHAAIGMALVALDGRWLKVNRALCQLTGYSESELLSKTFQDITHPDDLETDLAYIRQMLAGQIRTYQMEKRYFHKSGQVVWILLSVSLVRDAQDEPLYFVAQIEDITARKRGEYELKRRADEFTALYDTTRDLAQVQDLPTLLQTIVERAIRLLAVSGGGMYIYDAVRGDLEVKVATHSSTPVGTRLQMGEGMAGRVAQTRQPLIVDDYRIWPHRSPKYAGTPLTAVMEVPMLYGGLLIGVLVVEEEKETTRKFNEQDARLLSLFASHAASAVYNARLLAETKRRADEFAALYDITHDLAMQQDLPTLLRTIVDRAATLLSAPGGGIYLYDAGRGDLTMVAPKDGGSTLGLRLHLGEGLAGRVAQTRQPMIVDDYSRWEHRSRQYGSIPITAVVQVPMLYGGDLIGVLAVHELEATTRKFTEGDARLLSLFAGQAASAVHDTWLLDETQQRAQRQEALYHISTSLTRMGEAQELCETVVRECRDFLGYPFLGIFLLEPGTGDRVMQAQSGWDDAPKDWRLHPGEGLSEKAILTGALQYWPDVTREPRYVPGKGGYYSELDIPIKTGGWILGVLIVEAPRVDAFDHGDFEVLQAVANQLAVALENAQLFAEQRQLSITDGLTGLFNRRHFMELAQREFWRAHRLNSPCAVLMLDLNDLKRVNDTFGHSAGDEALQLVAKTLAKNIRAIDVVARYGGDEFVILIPDCRHLEAQQIAARLQKESRTLHLSLENRSVGLSFSLGIAVSTLEPEETLDNLLRRADAAMYQVKSPSKT